MTGTLDSIRRQVRRCTRAAARAIAIAIAIGGVGLAVGTAAAQEAPVEPDPVGVVDRATAEDRRLMAQEAQRVELAEQPVLDPAIFTEISPYAAGQDAVRLPDDQRLD
jgi:hypothetical protein